MDESDQHKKFFYTHHLGGLGASVLRYLVMVVIFRHDKVAKKGLSKKYKLIQSRRSVIMVFLAAIKNNKPKSASEIRKFMEKFDSESALTDLLQYLPEPHSNLYDNMLKEGRVDFGEHYLFAIQKKKKQTISRLKEKTNKTPKSLLIKGLAKPEINVIRTGAENLDATKTNFPPAAKTDNLDEKNATPDPDYRSTYQSSFLPYTGESNVKSLADLGGERTRNESENPKTNLKAKKTATINIRDGQASFREQILGIYGNKCCISNCEIMDVIEAAHIHDYSESKNNDLTNGVCLRVDIHRLFDRGLINIQTDYVISVDPILKGSDYWYFNGKKISLPKHELDWPKRKNLIWRLLEKNTVPPSDTNDS